MDEILFAGYRNMTIKKPLIIIACPRSGTTSLHEALSMDPNLISPHTSDLILPFMCANIFLKYCQRNFPNMLRRVERFLKKQKGISKDMELRHPSSLFSFDADDILLGEWNWVSLHAVRTFPVEECWWKNYDFSSFSKNERRKILTFHSLVCKKKMFMSVKGGKCNQTLLLRSHLSQCTSDFKEIYPDAVFAGIIRDPIDILRSFAGLYNSSVYASSGVRMFPVAEEDVYEGEVFAQNECCIKVQDVEEKKVTWSSVIQLILDDMMRREAKLYSKEPSVPMSNYNTGHIKFIEFKKNLVGSIKNLYEQIGFKMGPTFILNLQYKVQAHHEYKKNHQYKNPTLNQLAIRKKSFLAMPGVKRYMMLLNHADKK